MVLASALVYLPALREPAQQPQRIAKPYVAVLKMHLMIFVFAGLNGLGATNFFFYAAVLLVYFFPWRIAPWRKA